MVTDTRYPDTACRSPELQLGHQEQGKEVPYGGMSTGLPTDWWTHSKELASVPVQLQGSQHHEIWKYHQSTSKAHAKVLQNLNMHSRSVDGGGRLCA